jgi:hypothetical protein
MFRNKHNNNNNDRNKTKQKKIKRKNKQNEKQNESMLRQIYKEEDINSCLSLYLYSLYV